MTTRPTTPPTTSSQHQHQHQHQHDLATLAAGGYTGWWNETGQPAPWPDDFFDPDSEWRPDIQLVTHEPDEQPF